MPPEDFERELSRKRFKDRIENSPPIGAGPDGEIVAIPPWQPIPHYEPKIVK